MEPAQVKVCPNCNTPQLESARYCHHCGQKNTTLRKPLWQFLYEFLDANFNFDSKIFRAAFFLLFKPGSMTKAYIDGKRSRYLPPMRVYLFFSVFFFAGLIGSVPKEEWKAQDENFTKLKNAYQLDSLKTEAKKIFEAQKSIRPTQSLWLDSLGSQILSLFPVDTSVLNSFKDTISINLINIHALQLPLKDILYLSEDSLLNKHKIEEPFARTFARQGIKLFKSPSSFIQDFIGSKLWWATLLLIPITALLLKLIYIRRKFYYSEHLIFSFHYYALSLLLGIPVFYISNDWKLGYTFTVLGLLFIYKTIAMKVVYGQNWLKTIFKAFILEILIWLCLGLGLVIAGLASIFLF